MGTFTSTRKLDLSSSPPIFVLPTHLQPEEQHETEDKIYQAGGHITYDAKEARLFIGRVAQKKRAAFDLRAKGVWTDEAALPEHDPSGSHADGVEAEGPARKKVRLSTSTRGRRATSSTASASSEGSRRENQPSDVVWPDLSNHVLVVKLAWLEASIKEGYLVPYKPYIVYTARIVPKPDGQSTPTTSPTQPAHLKAGSSSSSQRRTSKPDVASILERAKAEAATLPAPRRRWDDHGRHANTSPTQHKRPQLHRQTTSEMEYLSTHPLPPLPEWATGPNATYSSCRSTFLHPPNEAFISQLTKIKEARLLRLDDIGVRAYSTSIASISAYPHHIAHPEEITRLPGCDQKIATLWREWQDSADTDAERTIPIVNDLDAEPDIQGLRLFWNIWGVGPDTARKFYFEHGWRELDDVVEFGWKSLTRVQQIGVKYYEEFLQKIPREEVELIRDVVLRHARRVLNIPESKYGTHEDVDCVIVGGYRRGKAFSGDVDVVLSHRDENKTKDLVGDVVGSLEEEGWVTHTLTLHTTTSDRGQATLPYRAKPHGGHGFDSLDKALCVWQDPNFEDDVEEGDGGGEEEAEKPRKKNPNIHRRVDIIISSWRTVGCAILGWSGGTTFQRDIRRYVAKVHGLKFDSSGVRNRGNGHVLDLEAPRPKNDPEVVKMLLQGERVERGDERWKGVEWDDKDTWEDRERRLMDGLGIGYRPATERCTG
ncbi:hypothetical protein H2200_007332 [Cladophialophora chaetospira]|uniref:BRCT domain-containing protein n=1 Tax=Cladophialophora chaetospira TaxID=386627 RepID=A0AA38X7T0_9EURO|nr:hypothetical protein H2200_007332 [Cladophialophora chaetospira]